MKIQILYVIINEAGEYFQKREEDRDGGFTWWAPYFHQAALFTNRPLAESKRVDLGKGHVFRVEIKPEPVDIDEVRGPKKSGL